MTDTDRGAADGQSSSPCRFWRQLGPEVVLKGKPCHRVYAETGKNDDLVLVHHKGQFYAMDAWCSHLGGPLFEGDIEDLPSKACLVCPWHGYKFELESGVEPNLGMMQEVYAVKVEEGQVYVDYWRSQLSLQPRS